MHALLKNARVIALFFLVLGLTVSVAAVQQIQDIRQRAQSGPGNNQVEITITDFQFSQSSITIPAGTRVRWTNRSNANLPHTTSSDNLGGPESWDSGFLEPGQSFTKTFNTPGVYNYHCNVHPSMTATIIVTSSVVTATPTPRVPTPTRTPTPTPGSGVPSPVCLGSCPTSPPTPTTMLTPVPSSPVTPTLPSTTIQPTEPEHEPCSNETQVGAAAEDSHDTHIAGRDKNKDRDKDNRGKGKKGDRDDRDNDRSETNIFFVILEFFLRLLQLIFGNIGLPLPAPTPTPTPTPAPNPTIAPSLYPTVSILPTQSQGATGVPSVYPTVSPTVYPSGVPTSYPSASPTVYPSASPTPYPTAPANATATPTPPCDPTPSYSDPSPSPFSRSIDDFKYIPGGNEPLKDFNLSAEAIGGSADRWGYDGKIHGPEIRVTEGDRVRISFQNNLPESTTIHWHGIKIFASQDGVAGVTQDAIPAGEPFTYDFLVPDVGTYWYHSHQNTAHQLPKGLYGPLIVEPKGGIPQERDYTVMYGNQGAVDIQKFEANPGDTVRVRLINSREPDFTGAPVRVALVGVPFKVAAIDGQEINQPQNVESQLISIVIAARYDLVFTMPASGSVKMYELGNMQTVQFGEGEAVEPPNLNTLPLFSYMDYGVPASDPRLPKTTFDAEHTIVIGQNLSLNGKLMPNVPDMVVKEGQVIKIRYVNNSNMHHSMHLHGHFYRLLKKNEVDLTGAPIYMDTIDMAPGETVEAAVVVDNPGVWMLHCHVMGHASVGMMMLMKFDDVHTPYEFGHGTGNIPE